MKKQILEIIFSRFHSWSDQFGFACARGCAFCCTRDVMITAPEGELLLDFIACTHGLEWLRAKLDRHPAAQTLSQTTNEYAAACLAGRDSETEEVRSGGTCPFLEDNVCTVYPARPFACRCLVSTSICRRGGNAALPAGYLSAATAVSQIIEHLGQFRPWGNMLTILSLLGSAAGADGPGLAETRGRCRTARPLPGFLIEEELSGTVVPLLDDILHSRIGERTVEDILNGR